ncbi:restriction endonuclease [bacterium]|nr:restriction endonuclease [bacterium]
MSERVRQLYYGDCLSVMREQLADESVDLVYLDPPFNSKATYNVLFKPPEKMGEGSQIKAFDDTWHWNLESEREYDEILQNPQSSDLANLMEALRRFLGINDMLAYIVHMANRLLEIRRVMKPTASVYLHCDPTASHYLKLVMDGLFGAKNFRNEVIWHYSGWNRKLRDSYNKRHDVILFYSKDIKVVNFNSYALPWESEGEYVKVRKQKVRLDSDERKYVLSDKGGGERVKRYLSEAMVYGKPVDTIWDIPKLNNSDKEKLSYPTQKPQALLERIIEASSNEGDVVFDPFCGCGTSIHAAEALKRNWIGIDITHLAIALIKKRLTDAFGELAITTRGLPTSYAGAMELARADKHQFELWVIGLLNAQPYKGGRKGADTGIDGYLRYKYIVEGERDPERGTAIIEVKGGQTGVKDIRNLDSVITREQAEQGILVSAVKPTKKMLEHAAGKGLVKLGFQEYPVMQVIWLKDLMEGKAQVLHPSYRIDHTKQAPKQEGKNQLKMEG